MALQVLGQLGQHMIPSGSEDHCSAHIITTPKCRTSRRRWKETSQLFASPELLL